MYIPRFILRSPARVSIIGFAAIISLGASLLVLPEASTGQRIGFIDALFTSASATCVTGLTVLDTGHSLSLFGQIVVLTLIQTGGLGIMTISTLFILIAGRRPSMIGRIVIQNTFTHGEARSVFGILRDVAVFTLVIESIGSVFLFFRFLPENTPARAFYLSVFHSVSAFCNAGFALFSDSFRSYRGDWVMNLVICFLIISGGIGFLVLSELKDRFPYSRRTWSRLSLHSKLALSSTAILIVCSSVLIVSMEWHNTLVPLSFGKRCLAGFFQAVTTRTAGFNTLPIGELSNETLFVIILLMFVGASPGSCGGGIKTTTVACLATLGVSRLRGRKLPQVFNRTISPESVGKAVSIVMISFLLIFAATLLLLMTELGEVAHPVSRGKFLELLFEVVSAFGTVGLSIDVTGGLSDIGKLIVTLVMFVGRLGPLMIAIAVSRRETSRYYFAEEHIMVG